MMVTLAETGLIGFDVGWWLVIGRLSASPSSGWGIPLQMKAKHGASEIIRRWRNGLGAYARLVRLKLGRPNRGQSANHSGVLKNYRART